MSVSIGFISFTISVLKSILPVSTGTSGGNMPDGNLPGEVPLSPYAENFPVDENQLAEIIAQATSKLLEKTELNSEIVSASLPPIGTPENKTDELTKLLSDSISATTKEIKKLEQTPVEEYEDVLITEYFLKDYYGQQDYIKFKRKIDVVEFKERIDSETDLKQKFQQDLLERQRMNVQKDEFEKINLKAIRDFQERMISDKLKDNKKD